MNSHLRVGEKGTDIIKTKESFSAKWYLCPAKKWTIAWGHVKLKGDTYKTVDKVMGEVILRKDCLIAENCIKENVTVALNQNQFDALVSFIFNIGIGAFSTSTILKMINDGDFDSAAEQFIRWIHPKSAERGLRIRRAMEKALFISAE